MLNVVGKQKVNFQSEQMDMEEKIAEMEVRAILDKTLEIGDGDIVVGFIKAVDMGVVDSPMSTNMNVKSQVLGIRDNEGAVRYMDHGNLPFTKEIVEFNKEKIAEREKAQGRKVDYGTVVNDLFSMSAGSLVIRC